MAPRPTAIVSRHSSTSQTILTPALSITALRQPCGPVTRCSQGRTGP
ncbi:hypothetical protein SGM_5978 [Streptomyces griseoaurantiacus M045]|uniref:Uncharacterized protein n=1 Tax=Streptomyces griseoaurantiacus M045 TaxID=996637 RepID=F3NS64_9ACTN|nr:hypothetical protein SGM_5978 [Streptomyces griseoaurantiacus M045]